MRCEILNHPSITHSWIKPRIFVASLALLACLLMSSTGFAWQAVAKKTAPAAEEEKIPEPTDERLEVKTATEKFIMRFTYYKSLLGKSAVPIIMLHGNEGSRGDYELLARYLQQQGHAVIVPDLRGHGDSTTVIRADGKRIELVPKDIKPADFLSMMSDIDVIKSWMLERNNAGEFNLEMLVVIGSDMTTVTALNWTLRDWTAPQLLNYKNGQDVKALVLLSPEQNHKGMTVKDALAHPNVGGELAMLVAVGKKSPKAWDEAKRLVATLERNHIARARQKGENVSDKGSKEDEIVLLPVDTNLQGTKLLERNLKVGPYIAQFIKVHVLARVEEFDYSERIKP